MSQGRTDNEQAMPTGDTLFLAQNIINQIADLYSERIPSADWVPVRQATNDQLDEWVSGLIAAHRVTLVADSREALILWLDRYELANSSMPRKIGWHSDLADVLLASGVVQVTTPTETDETPAESAMRDYAHALDSNDSADGWGKEEVILDILRWADGYASRPAPVAPPAEEWEDPEEWERIGNPYMRRAGSDLQSKHGWRHKPRTREQYEADQKPVVPVALTDEQADILTLTETFDSFDALTVPVDALGFPTQEGATFTARFKNKGLRRRLVVVPESPNYYRRTIDGCIVYREDLDPTSIEDVRPADGRGGQ